MYVAISAWQDEKGIEAGAIGPFSTEDEAYEWAYFHWTTDLDWNVSIIISPEDF